MNRWRTWSAALAVTGTWMAADEATAQNVTRAWELVQAGGKELPAVLEETETETRRYRLTGSGIEMLDHDGHAAGRCGGRPG